MAPAVPVPSNTRLQDVKDPALLPPQNPDITVIGSLLSAIENGLTAPLHCRLFADLILRPGERKDVFQILIGDYIRS